jgi:phosphoribosylformimino-5-aminoimidazole carboxamide ribotide isomerase
VRLIPALDLAGGGVVRLEAGAFERSRRYAEPAEAWLERFAAAGARAVHLVDLDAARDGRPANRAAIAALLGRGVELQVAGGIRSRAAALDWLARGAARVVVGSAAVDRPREVARWLDELGPERVVLAFDVRLGADGARRVATRGWRTDSGRTLEESLAAYRDAGLRHAMATAIERDGRLAGPDLDLYPLALSAAPRVAWQASGGVRDAADLAALAAAGAAGAIVGRALLEGRLPLSEIARWSRNGSSPVST